MSLLLFWAHRTLNYARKTVGGEFLIPVYCQAGEEVGRAPHRTLFATLTLAKTNIRGRETFFNVHSQSGPCQIFDIFGIEWAESVSQPQKSLQRQPDSLYFLLQAQLDATKEMLGKERMRRCRARRNWSLLLLLPMAMSCISHTISFPISSLEMSRRYNNLIYETAQVTLRAAMLFWDKYQGTGSLLYVGEPAKGQKLLPTRKHAR